MNPEDLNIQNLEEPNIVDPTEKNRRSFIRGWNEAVEGTSLETAEQGEDNWRTVGWHAGETFGKHDNEFRYALFLWTLNQRRKTIGLEEMNSLP